MRSRRGIFRATPKLVTIHKGEVSGPYGGRHNVYDGRYEHVQDPKSGMWYYRLRAEYVDEALIAAYTEAVGHEPRNFDPTHPGYYQWTYNPRSKHSKTLAELFPEVQHVAA